MADVAVTVQQMVPTGLAQTYQAPNTTDTYVISNDGLVFLHVKKTGAGSCNVTVVTSITVGGLAVTDQIVAVPATTGDRMIGPFATNIYNTDGALRVTFSEITGLTFAAVHI